MATGWFIRVAVQEPRLNKTFLRAIFGISIEKYVDIRRTGVNTWMLSFRNEDVCVTVLRVTENMVMIVDTNGFTKMTCEKVCVELDSVQEYNPGQLIIGISGTDDEGQKDCRICHDDYKPGEMYRRVDTCGHCFHTTCVWMVVRISSCQ
ncbi:hypothetical protein FPQ18DRAFT_309984 [Pyronema domesticum]|nr:hypothetical protein FPQ18DRAFT_309984 [Pyronema domesticum]